MKELGEVVAVLLMIAMFVAVFSSNGCSVTINDQVYRLKFGVAEE